MQGVSGGGGVGTMRGVLSLLRNSPTSTYSSNPGNVKYSAALLLSTFPGGSTTASMSVGGVRHKHSKRVNPQVQKLVEGAQRFTGFSYFPRNPEKFEDPPIEPAKLFMVRRIRSLFGCPWWEKDAIAKLKLEKMGSITIVKNTPKNNADLYQVKHLVEITPITMPYGMPDDPRNGFLKENGEFVSYNSLDDHKILLEEAESKLKELKKISVDGETLKNRLRQKYYDRWD